MPRCFFHVIDGTGPPDVCTARAQAIRLSGEILCDMGGRFRDGAEWRLEVQDARGRTSLVLRFSAGEWLPGPSSGAKREAGPGSG